MEKSKTWQHEQFEPDRIYITLNVSRLNTLIKRQCQLNKP